MTNNPSEEQAESCLLKEGCLFKQVVTGGNMSHNEIWKLKVLVLGIMSAIILLIGIPIFVMTYPFKTVVFTQPVEVVAPRKTVKIGEIVEKIPQVPVNGVVHMKVVYKKYIDSPGLVIRTLIRKKGSEIQVLDSSTVVTTRGKGAGIADATFALNPNGYLVGSNTYVVFSIYYTLFGVRPMMVQYETEKFDITEVPGIILPQCPLPTQDWQHSH